MKNEAGTLRWVVAWATLALGIDVLHAQSIYWYTGELQRSNLLGVNVVTILKDTGGWGIAVDTIHRKLYWTDGALQRVRRAELNGTVLEDIVMADIERPWGLAIDPLANKIYWADFILGRVSRANLDGSNVEIIISNEIGVKAIGLDLKTGKLYWTRNQLVRRSNLDGSQIEDVLSEPVYEITTLALDVENSHIYWIIQENATYSKGAILRANLDGSGMTTLIGFAPPFQALPEQIALAVDRGEMYWTDRRFGIRRSNLDGSNAIYLLSVFQPSGIALDLVCCQGFGDIVPPGGNTSGQCELDVDDVLCVLDDFVSPGFCLGADLFPCGGNGIIDVDDIVAVLDAFMGYAKCKTACP